MKNPLARVYCALAVRLHGVGGDRGDVMTAGLVTAIWLVADGQLTAVLDRAISSVSKP